MKKVNLTRFAYTKLGAFGKLYIDDAFIGYTVERPWLNNKPYESCIPEGAYKMVPSRYNRGGYDAYEVLNVPDRTHIKLHVGNTMADVVGCVGMGNELGYIDHKWAVLNSKATFTRFMDAMDGCDGSLIVDNVMNNG